MADTFVPKKKWGQNFLIDKNISKKIVSQIPKNISKVVEIGPGKGILTYLIAEKYKTSAIEIDPFLASKLQGAKNLSIINKDALKVSKTDILEPEVLIGNLPYNITVPIILHFFAEFPTINEMIIMVQKEMAFRILSTKDTKTYGIPSLKVKYFADTKILFNVSKTVFLPVPKVDSVVLKLKTHNKYNKYDYSKFSKIVDLAFKHRRKLLKSNLADYDLGEFSHLRAENLSIDDYIKILDKTIF